MKKWIALFLSVLMLTALFACRQSAAPAPEAGVNEANESEIAEPTEAPTEAPTPEPTEEPTPEPTPEPKQQFAAAREKVSRLNSMHQDLVQDISLTMSIPMISMSQSISTHYDLHQDSQKDPLLSKTEGTVTAYDESHSILLYTEQIDGVVTTYTSYDDGKTWFASSDVDSASDAQSAQETLNWLNYIDDVEITGTETNNGVEATVFSGTIDAACMKEGSAMLGDLTGDGEGLDWDSMPGLPFTAWIDQASGYIVQLRIEFGGMLLNILTKSMESNGLPAGSVEITVESAYVDLSLSDFDAIAPIVIPPEARANTQTQTDADADGIVGTWVLSDGEDEDAQQTVQMLLSFGMEMELTLRADGTGTMTTTYSDENETEEFTYVFENGQLTIEDESTDCRIEDGKLHLLLDDMPLIFTRK